jgi:hypothetical protein
MNPISLLHVFADKRKTLSLQFCPSRMIGIALSDLLEKFSWLYSANSPPISYTFVCIPILIKPDIVAHEFGRNFYVYLNLFPTIAPDLEILSDDITMP